MITSSRVLILVLTMLPVFEQGAAADRQPLDREAMELAAAHGSAAFGIDLYGALREEEGNLFFSPAAPFKQFLPITR